MGELLRFNQPRPKKQKRSFRIPKGARRRRHLGGLPEWIPLVGLVCVASIMIGGYELAERDLFTYRPDQAPEAASKPKSWSIAQARKGEIIGRASVIDGDTVEILGERIRFNGVDAPESSQGCEDGAGNHYRCGAISAHELSRFLAQSSPARCEFVIRDRYGRFVGNCFRADGRSVASWLVRNGYALDWPRYSGGKYSAEQRAAQAEKRGIWQGAFEKPWEWRRKHR